MKNAQNFIEKYKLNSKIVKGSKQEEAFNKSVEFYFYRYIGLQSNDVKGVKFNCPKSLPNCDLKTLRKQLQMLWLEGKLTLFEDKLLRDSLFIRRYQIA